MKNSEFTSNSDVKKNGQENYQDFVIDTNGNENDKVKLIFTF